jgi:hypothetical protein
VIVGDVVHWYLLFGEREEGGSERDIGREGERGGGR